MAEKKPYGWQSGLLPLDLRPSQMNDPPRPAGRLAGRCGERPDAHPEKMRNPELARQDAEAFERLLSGRGPAVSVLVPDETARAVIEAAAHAYDEASEYAEIVANHDALHGLLAALRSGGVVMWRSGGGAWRRRLRRAPSLSAMTDEELQRVVLDVILREYPVLLTFPSHRLRAVREPRRPYRRDGTREGGPRPRHGGSSAQQRLSRLAESLGTPRQAAEWARRLGSLGLTTAFRGSGWEQGVGWCLPTGDGHELRPIASAPEKPL